MMSRNSENHTANANRARHTGVVAVSAQQQQQKKKRKRKKGDDIVAGGDGDTIRIENNTTNSISLYSDRERCACSACSSSETYSYRNALNSPIDIERHVPDTASLAPPINGERSIVVDASLDGIDFLRSQTANNCGPSVGRRDGAHRFAVYENLCEFCGFAIGTGSYHLNCAVAQSVRADEDVANNNNNTRHSFSENIYENICKSCHLIYSGDKCERCECEIETRTVPTAIAATKVNTIASSNDELTAPTKPKQLTRQFGVLFGSLKQKFRERKAPAPPPASNVRNRKIEIIHSSDQQVFKTNQTFDLNEIVQLKLQQQRDKHIYGKLRKNSCVTAAPNHQANRSFRPSASESNFFNCHFGRDHQLPFHSSPYSDSIVSDTCLYAANSYAEPPSYEDAIQNSLYTSVCIESTTATTSHSSSALSLLTQERERQSIAATAAAAVGELLVNNASLKHWMTSLRRQTHNYDSNNSDRSFDCATVKCVPSKLVYLANGDGVERDDAVLSAELRERIEAFQVNVVQRMHAKQTINYCVEIPSAQIADESFAATIGNSEIELETTATSNIEVENVDSVESSACAVTNATECGFGELSTTIHNYLQCVKTFYIAQITLSTSLNRIVLVCGDKKLHYLIKLLGGYGGSLTERHRVRQITSYTKYTNINSLFIALHAMSAQRQLVVGADGDDDVDAAGQRSPKSKFNDFLMATSSEGVTKQFEDFDKTGDGAVGGQKKTLNDFVVKKTHASSAAAVDDVNATHESIYQSIWTFKTIGHASSESDLNEVHDECGCGGDGARGDDIDETTIDDGSEWEEVTEEEFLFSNDRFNSTTMNHVGSESREKIHAADPIQTYPYQSVCILYSADDAKYNKIIYDYNGNHSILANANEYDGTDSIGACSLSGSNTELLVENESRHCKLSNSTRKAQATEIRFDSVDAWKSMISSSNCLEDEEDLVSLDENGSQMDFIARDFIVAPNFILLN